MSVGEKEKGWIEMRISVQPFLHIMAVPEN